MSGRLSDFLAQPDESDRAGWPLLIPALLLIFWLGVVGLDADTVWWDELTSIAHTGHLDGVSRSPAQIIASLRFWSTGHVPLYFFLLSAWGHVAGWSVFALRALSLLLGVLTVALTYRLGRDMISARAGLYAAAIMGTTGFFVYYLHELRMYSMQVLTIALVVWLYHRVLTLRRMPPWWLWLILALAVAALLYTHFYSIFALASIGLYHLLLAPRNRRWWGISLAALAGGLLFLPWVEIILSGMRNIGANEALQGRALSWGEAVIDLVNIFSGGHGLLFALTALLALPGLGHPRGAGRAWFLALAGLAVLLVFNQFSAVLFVGRWRYFLVLWPLLALVMGMGLAGLGRRGRYGQAVALALLAIWLAVGVADSFARLRAAQWLPLHHVARELDGRIQSGELLIGFTRQPLSAKMGDIGGFYLDHLAAQGLDYRLDEYAPSAELPPDEMRAAFAEIAAGRLVIWHAFTPDAPPSLLAALGDALDADYTLCESRAYHYPAGSMRLDRYVLSAAGCLPDADDGARLIRYANDVALVRAELGQRTENAILLVLGWSVPEGTPLHQYSVSAQVFDAVGEKVGQADAGLPGIGFSWQPLTIQTPGIAPGSYRVMLTVYDWQTGERLPGTVIESGQQGDFLPLTDVMITDTGHNG